MNPAALSLLADTPAAKLAAAWPGMDHINAAGMARLIDEHDLDGALELAAWAERAGVSGHHARIYGTVLIRNGLVLAGGELADGVLEQIAPTP